MLGPYFGFHPLGKPEDPVNPYHNETMVEDSTLSSPIRREIEGPNDEGYEEEMSMDEEAPDEIDVPDVEEAVPSGPKIRDGFEER